QVDVRADAAGDGLPETSAESAAGRAFEERFHPAVQPLYRRGDILDELAEEPRARAQGLDQLRQVRSEHRGGGQHRDRGRQAHHRRLNGRGDARPTTRLAADDRVATTRLPPGGDVLPAHLAVAAWLRAARSGPARGRVRYVVQQLR